MNPWTLRALDLAAALVAGAGLVLILAAALARRPSFVDRVAQGRVQERPPSALAAWARREIAMLLPVVFLILPVTVMFALYPGLIALDFTP